MKSTVRYLRSILILLLALSLDIYTKSYVVTLLEQSPTAFLRPPYLHFFGFQCSLSFVMNQGAAWGLFSEFHFLLVGIRIAIILALTYQWIRTKEFLSSLGLLFIITGAIGNVIDTFFYGGVIDFIEIAYQRTHLFVFNIADAWISVGVVLLVVSYCRKQYRTYRAYH